MNFEGKSIKEIKKIHHEIARAVHFLVNTCLDKNGIQRPLKTGKPLVVHSLRAAFKLMELGYDEKVIIVAAVLHDIPEDTNVDPKILEKLFGREIADVVLACCFDISIQNKKERYIELFRRVKERGRNALVVKAVDILVNTEYIFFSKSVEEQKHVLEKWNYFLDIAKEISNEPVYKELADKVYHLNQSFDWAG